MATVASLVKRVLPLVASRTTKESSHTVVGVKLMVSFGRIDTVENSELHRYWVDELPKNTHPRSVSPPAQARTPAVTSRSTGV